MSETVIVLGHGSRRPEANEEIKAISRMVQESDPAWSVHTAFVEFAAPSLEDKVRELAEEGVGKILLVPVFLTVGNHLAQGLPRRLQALEGEYPGLELIMAEHLGADPLIAALVSKRAAQAMQKANNEGK